MYVDMYAALYVCMYVCKSRPCAIQKVYVGVYRLLHSSPRRYIALSGQLRFSCLIHGTLRGEGKSCRCQESSALPPCSLLAYRLRCPGLHFWIIYVCAFVCICTWIMDYL